MTITSLVPARLERDLLVGLAGDHERSYACPFGAPQFPTNGTFGLRGKMDKRTFCARREHHCIHIPVERPLTVFVDKRELVTLMTLGASPELLVRGLSRNQRLIGSVAEFASITVV